MSYVNKIKKGDKVYDVQDARIEDPSSLGGTKLYRHLIKDCHGEDAFILISKSSTPITNAMTISSIINSENTLKCCSVNGTTNYLSLRMDESPTRPEQPDLYFSYIGYAGSESYEIDERTYEFEVETPVSDTVTEL